MKFDRQKRLVERLLDRSRADEMAWEETPEDDVFQVSFSKSRVQISKIRRQNFNDYQIRITDEIDITTEIFSDYNLDKDDGLGSSKWRDGMGELHDLARRKALRADDILDSILSEIG